MRLLRRLRALREKLRELAPRPRRERRLGDFTQDVRDGALDEMRRLAHDALQKRLLHGIARGLAEPLPVRDDASLQDDRRHLTRVRVRVGARDGEQGRDDVWISGELSERRLRDAASVVVGGEERA
jgi:hypothetical protein